MDEILRILILEDNHADVELIQFELQEAGLTFIWKVVADEKEYVQAIQDYCPDLILSDYDLPTYNGALALAEANRRCPDTPFILVTGAVTEDRAIDILTQGAKDYVLKTRLEQRLVPAVRRALAEAEEHKARKQAEKELRQTKVDLERMVEERTAELQKELTERHLAEDELRVSDARYHELVRRIPIGVYLYRMHTEGARSFEYVSPMLCQILGVEAEALLSDSQTGFSTIHPDDLPGLITANDAAASNLQPFRWEGRCLVQGKIRWVRLESDPTLLPNGESLWSGVVTDVTERKEAGEALRRSQQLLKRTFVSLHDAIFIIDAETTKITECNPAASVIFGYSIQEMLGHTTEFLHADEATLTEFRRRLYSAVEGQGFLFLPEFAMKRKDGTVFPTEHSVMPVEDEEGTRLGWVSVVRDITERKKNEMVLADQAALLQERAAQLEATNKELESFSYSVSHDLRAPLRAIDGYSRMILKKQGDKFDEETKRQFDHVRNSAKDMESLVDNLLAFSRFGRATPTLADVDMEALVKLVWEELQESNGDRSITPEIDHLLPVMADRSLLKHVFVNLLANAIKFTRTREKALIQVGAYEEENEIIYYVKDNGVGFDMKYCDRLFGVFQRLHSADEYEGTGIGLAIVQRIIHHHGGRVWAEGKVNEGATFYFTLPGKGMAR
jgi:PAS domain S-box-containing protein